MSTMLIRQMLPRDVKLVTNSWLTNNRKSWAVKGVGNEIYYSNHHQILEALLPRCLTLMACDEQDPDTIYGWICCEPYDKALVVHYVYVKSLHKAREASPGVYTGFGIGKLLLREALDRYEPELLVYTHETRSGKEWLRHLAEKGELEIPAVYNPYLLYGLLGEEG